MKNPIVEMNGDEMTRVIWKSIKDNLILPFVDLNVKYYDLGLLNREKTFDQVTIDAANEIKKHKVGVKCATITPNLERKKEYKLTKLYKSPNATIRSILGGTVFREPIIVNGIKPLIPSFKKPIIIARHAFGDIYKNTEIEVKNGDKVYIKNKDKQVLINEFKNTSGVVQGVFNEKKSIQNFAHACFKYALEKKQDLWFSTKDTISKTYDSFFKKTFNEIFEKKYKNQFKKNNIVYFYTLIDDCIARVMKSQGGFIWACKNYDGDVFSDMLASVFGSLAMMTSVLVSPDGYFEYEAAHGTVQKHYYEHLKNKKTSTNSVASIFAWSGAIKKRGEIDNNKNLIAFGKNLEKAVIKTINDGYLTKDLYLISKTKNKKKVDTHSFINKVKLNLKKCYS